MTKNDDYESIEVRAVFGDRKKRKRPRAPVDDAWEDAQGTPNLIATKPGGPVTRPGMKTIRGIGHRTPTETTTPGKRRSRKRKGDDK